MIISGYRLIKRPMESNEIIKKFIEKGEQMTPVERRAYFEGVQDGMDIIKAIYQETHGQLLD